MCGFVGYLSTSESTLPDLDQWSSVIRHRGPDQAGQAIAGHFGIGTRRLSIQDLSAAGSQPMESDRYLVGFNGEIYNHFDLRTELQRQSSVQFASTSDTETILRCFDHWGIAETLERLNGMYALAVWDKERSELSLARDPLGVKPLSYLVSRGQLYFASELKALVPHSSGRLSDIGAGLYFYFGFVPAPYSLVDGIRKIRTGERLIFSPNRSIRSETILPRSWKNPKSVPDGQEQRVARLRSEVEAAVERQLLSDVPVGVFLSGGVDSTIIASAAARRKEGLHSFSLNPGSTSHDPGANSDARIAGELAERLGFRHHEVQLSPATFLDRIDTFLERMDEPVAELYAMGEMLLSEAAREQGVPVVLTGHGGDELFLGYPTYNAVFRGDLYNKIPFFGYAAELVSRSRVLSESMRTNLRGAASIWRLSTLQRYATVSGVHFNLDEAASSAGLEPARLQQAIDEILDDARSMACLLPNADGTCNAELFARMDTVLMVPNHYNARLDQMTMSASVEARVPFQDLELIGFVSQLTHQDLMRGGLKGMLRDAFASDLPDEITRRSKQTFQAPTLSWVTGELAPWIAERLPVRTGELTTSRTSTATIERSRTMTTRDAYQLWSLALLEGWMTATGIGR